MMKLAARTMRLVKAIVVIVIVSAVVGAGFAVLRGPSGMAVVLVGTLAGGSIGLLIIALEIVLQGPLAPRLRRLPLLVVILLRTILYGVAFIGTARLADLAGDLVALGVAAGTPSAMGIALSIIVSLIINFVVVLRRLLGPRTLTALVLGRYRFPREEERVVPFLDLVGSTQLAARPGNTGFHRFFNEVASDIADPVLETGGKIYRYVGDEIIVMWPFAEGVKNAVCLMCVFRMEEVLRSRWHVYRDSFGTVPELRAALHSGPLIIGQIGDVKREIVMIGDTMNTAACIEDACRSTGYPILASEGLALQLPRLPADVRMQSLGPIELRG